MVKPKRTIAITGGSGFIGIALVEELIKQGNIHIKILSRTHQENSNLKQFGLKIEVVTGDLLVPDSLKGFLDPDCTLVHLGYIKDGSEHNNLAATVNLLAACNEAKIKRIIHISTALVTGRTNFSEINESTVCEPVTEYGITKLKIEETIRGFAGGGFEVVILRPTSVFGPSGGSLLKLFNDIYHNNKLKNYLKACLFNRRCMNLVYVENVVAAVVFMLEQNSSVNGEVFIISEDDCSKNNFLFVETLFRKTLGRSSRYVPVIPIPLNLLAFFLRILGRDIINPMTKYNPKKMLNLGFKRPFKFEESVVKFLIEEGRRITAYSRSKSNRF